jgi:hypothetical protein
MGRNPSSHPAGSRYRPAGELTAGSQLPPPVQHSRACSRNTAGPAGVGCNGFILAYMLSAVCPLHVTAAAVRPVGR